MKRISLFLLLTAGVIILSACSGPAAAAKPASQPESAKQTAEPVTDPTQAPGAAEGSTQVEVTLQDYTIASSLTTFKTGVPYTLVISNNGQHEHNLNISPPVAAAGGYSEALAQALLSVDQSQIPPGSTTTIDFTFPASAVGATLEFNCLIRRHYEDGMHLGITVTS